MIHCTERCVCDDLMQCSNLSLMVFLFPIISFISYYLILISCYLAYYLIILYSYFLLLFWCCCFYPIGISVQLSEIIFEVK